MGKKDLEKGSKKIQEMFKNKRKTFERKNSSQNTSVAKGDDVLTEIEINSQ